MGEADSDKEAPRSSREEPGREGEPGCEGEPGREGAKAKRPAGPTLSALDSAPGSSDSRHARADMGPPSS